MERVYGGSFADVELRVSDRETARLGGRDARALAAGNQVLIRNSDFAPGSPSTHLILAHELAHIRQQSLQGGTAGAGRLEREADQAAVQAISGQPGRLTPSGGTGLRLQACSVAEMPQGVEELTVDQKAALVVRSLDEGRLGAADVVIDVFGVAASQSQFVALQEALDMQAVFESLDDWDVVRLGALGPVVKADEILTRKRAEHIRDATHDYGLALAQVHTAFIIDTTQDDQVIAVLEWLAADNRLADTIGQMPAINDRLQARGIDLSSYSDRALTVGDVGRSLAQGVLDLLGDSEAARSVRGQTLMAQNLDLPEAYGDAASEILHRMLEEAMTPGNVALGAVDTFTLGIPSGLYGLVVGTASGLTDLWEGDLDDGARQLVPALIVLATLGAGRVTRSSGGAAPRAGGGAGPGPTRVRFVSPAAGGALTLEQAVAQFPGTLRASANALLQRFSPQELRSGADWARQNSRAAGVIEQHGNRGLRSLLDNNGNVPAAAAALAAGLTGDSIVDPGEAPDVLPAAPDPLRTTEPDTEPQPQQQQPEPAPTVAPSVASVDNPDVAPETAPAAEAAPTSSEADLGVDILDEADEQDPDQRVDFFHGTSCEVATMLSTRAVEVQAIGRGEFGGGFYTFLSQLAAERVAPVFGGNPDDWGVAAWAVSYRSIVEFLGVSALLAVAEGRGPMPRILHFPDKTTAVPVVYPASAGGRVVALNWDQFRAVVKNLGNRRRWPYDAIIGPHQGTSVVGFETDQWVFNDAGIAMLNDSRTETRLASHS